MNKYNPTDPLQVFIEKVNTLVDGFNQLETDRQTHHDFVSYVKDEVFSTYGNRPYLFKSLEEVRKTKLLELDDYVIILKENPNHTIYPEIYVIKEKENDLIGETVPLLNSELVAVRIADGLMSSDDKIKLNELNYTKAMTQAQYDALSTAEKNRTDVWYGIYEE